MNFNLGPSGNAASRADEYDADLRARWAIELVKNTALRRAVGDAGCDTETARLIWSLGFCSGNDAGLVKAKQIIEGKTTP